MKRLCTRQQATRIDERAQQEGWSADILMESAANMSLVELSHAFYPELHQAGETWIVCGAGHNGGDGLALARHLHSSGITSLRVLLVGEAPTPLTLRQRQLCERQGLRVSGWQEQHADLKTIRPNLIVDALFGVGLNRPLEGVYLECVNWMNQHPCPRVSLDVPSGLDCNRGTTWGACVRAHMTITFGLPKVGFYLQDGPSYTGTIRTHSIGFPPHLFVQEAKNHWLFDQDSARALLPSRSATAHKASFGRALICAGQTGTWGAALLASQACFRSGVGYTVLASHQDLKTLLPEFPEVMTLTLDDPQVFQKPWDAVGVGPGLGVGAPTQALLQRLRDTGSQHVVVDADAFTTLIQSDLSPLPESWVVTPHAGELARLLNISAQEIEHDRLSAAQQAVDRLGCHVVLKGYHTVVASPGEQVRVIGSGNVALAKAGSGDVLTGLLTGFLAQTQGSVQDTVSLAVYLHGFMADQWVQRHQSPRSLQPSDLIQLLPETLRQLESR